MALRYTGKPTGYSPQQTEDWRNRFPPHSKSMDSAPVMGSRPIKLFEPDGSARWGLHHLGCWREVERVKDPYTGAYQIRMKTGSPIIANPVRWASS